MDIEEEIKTAIIEALKGIKELNGCLPAEITITDPATDPSIGLCYHVVFDVPMPITFSGA
jgi:hypothetical protein